MNTLSLSRPTPDRIAEFLESQSRLDLSYPSVGATATTPPPGFVVDHRRVRLGTGESTLETAKAALRNWEQFRLGWVDIWPRSPVIRPGEQVAVMGRAVGLWWLNACRIVYTVDEPGPRSRFGFAYGTLPGHVECGEERFLVEWDLADDSVWYEILAFSRPNHVLTRLGYPAVRCLQKRFGRHSARAMINAVGRKDADVVAGKSK